MQKLFLEPPFHFNPNLAPALALLCTYRHSLPTGSPVSPVISNLVCLGMDSDLFLLARKHGYAYTRYADDLTFSGERTPEVGFFDSVARIAGEHGFTLNRRKTRIQKSTSRQTVTGIVANRKPNVDREYKRKLRAQLHTLDTLGPYSATYRKFRLKEAPTT